VDMDKYGLFSILLETSKSFANRDAVYYESQKLTYKALTFRAERMSAFLSSIGVKQGSLVALWLPNSPDYVALYFAIWRLGAIAVPLNYFWKESEIEFVLEDCNAQVLIVSQDRYFQGEALYRKGLFRHLLMSPAIFSKIDNFVPSAPVEVNLHSPALIIYTSGTTGKPKGAMLSHNNLISNVRSCMNTIQFSKRDSVLCILPLFHSFAVTVCMLIPISLGAKIVFGQPGSPKSLINVILKGQVSVLVGIPPLFSLMAEAGLPKWIKPWMIKLLWPVRIAISGASGLPVSVFENFQKKYGIPLLEGYGLTEASPVVSLNPVGRQRPGSVGLPISDVEVKIVDEAGLEVQLNKPGEIIVKGPNVMLGYLNRPQDTKQAIRNGWLYTGDLGYKDADGFLYIVGRKKDMINVRGLNVYPREIEDLLESHPFVKEAAVVGIKSKFKGERPVAFVVLREYEHISEQELIGFMRERLADYKVPARVYFIKELPKNALRKVEKQELIKLAESK